MIFPSLQISCLFGETWRKILWLILTFGITFCLIVKMATLNFLSLQKRTQRKMPWTQSRFWCFLLSYVGAVQKVHFCEINTKNR